MVAFAATMRRKSRYPQAMSYTLYYAPDNASLIVRIALEEMSLPYQTVLVDRAAREQQGVAYRAKIPSGKIPALDTPDGIIFETAAILLWLCERHGQLAPTARSPKRAAFLKWLFFTSNTIHADLRALFYPETYAPEQMIDAFHTMTSTRVGDALSVIDQHAAEWSGGQTPNIIDIYVSVILRWCALYPKGRSDWFNITRTPNLALIAENLETRPSVAAAVLAEGLGTTPITHPTFATPPEGSAT